MQNITWFPAKLQIRISRGHLHVFVQPHYCMPLLSCLFSSARNHRTTKASHAFSGQRKFIAKYQHLATYWFAVKWLIIHPTHQARLLIREAYLHAHVSSRTIHDPTNRPQTAQSYTQSSNAKSMLRSNAKSMFNFHFIVIARLPGCPYMFALLEIRQLLTTVA